MVSYLLIGHFIHSSDRAEETKSGKTQIKMIHQMTHTTFLTTFVFFNSSRIQKCFYYSARQGLNYHGHLS